LGSKIDKNSRSWPFETDLFVESFRVFSLLDFCFSPGLWLRGEVELLFFFDGRKQGENVPERNEKCLERKKVFQRAGLPWRGH
jgi:hypothetical protein